MAQLWGGRFTKATEQKVYDFNASITFDKALIDEDIEGSVAHVVMLEKQGILTLEEKDAIVSGLAQIRKDVEDDRTSTHIIELDQKNSINELARIIGGDIITANALKTAEELYVSGKRSAS